MRKPIRIAILAGAAGVIVAGGTATAFAVQSDSQPTKATTTSYSTSATTAPGSPKAAGKVNAGQARHIAQQRVPGGTVTETDFDHEHGKAVWEVDLTKNSRHYEIYVDAATGKIIGVSASKASGSHASPPAAVKAAKVNAAQARHIAQQRVPAGMVTETDFDHEHGKAVWEVDLTKSNRHYEVRIDAVTGKVLNVHAGADMADHD